MDEVLKDITIRCAECEENFLWTVREQEFFKQRGLQNQPNRCINCRKKRREKLKGEKKLMDIRCGKCGLASTARYFETADKPIYCPECFESLKNSSGSSDQKELDQSDQKGKKEDQSKTGLPGTEKSESKLQKIKPLQN